MYTRFARAIIVVAIALTPVVAVAQRTRPAIVAGCPTDFVVWHQCALQKAQTFTPPRTPTSKPDFQGYWRPIGNVQEQNIEGVAEDHILVTSLPPSYRWNPGPSLIIDPADRKIPYQPWAARIGRSGGVHEREYVDPRAECGSGGVPRLATSYRGHQILQPPTDDHVLWAHEDMHQFRVIAMDSRPPVGQDVKTWNGLSRGRWEGDTLVIQTANFNGYTWLDDSGNFYSDTARVTERLTMVDQDTLHYGVTIEDPTVYTRPWMMAWPLVRDTTPGGAEFYEEACREGDRDLGLTLSQGFKLYYGATWRSR